MGNPLEGNTQTKNKLSPLDELYYKLGKAYYEGAFEDPLPELLPLFDKITELKASGQISDISAAWQACQSYCGSCSKIPVYLL